MAKQTEQRTRRAKALMARDAAAALLALAQAQYDLAELQFRATTISDPSQYDGAISVVDARIEAAKAGVAS